MAQLIHDVAPGAAISFHTAFNSELDFAEGIIELADAGADVIVDDVRYFVEPFFMDGMVAQAVDIVAERGVPYYSSAGNQARQLLRERVPRHQRADERGQEPERRQGRGSALPQLRHGTGAGDSAAGLPAADRGGRVYDLQLPVGPAAPDGDDVRANEGGAGSVACGRGRERSRSRVLRPQAPRNSSSVQPVYPMAHAGSPASSRAIATSAATRSTLGHSFSRVRRRTAQLFFIGIVVSGGPDPGVVKYSWFDNQGIFGVLDFATNSGTSFGHSNAAGNQAIGAASWYVTEPFSTSGLVPPNDTQTPAIDLSPCAPGVPERLLVGRRHPDLLRSVRHSPGGRRKSGRCRA